MQLQLAGLPEAQAGAPPGGARVSVRRWVARSAAIIHRKTLPAGSRNQAWAAKLGQVIADLGDLNRATERDFLAIGGKLAEFMQAVTAISSELTALVDLLSGECCARASEALASALDRAREMSAGADGSSRLLGSMRNEAGRLGQTLGGFEGTVSTFHTIGVLTRVETARLGAGADFGNLAEDVKLLAGDIQVRIAGALDTAAELIPTIESLLNHVTALEEEQAQDLPAVIAGVLASLASFREIQTRMHGASVHLAARYDAILAAFHNLVVSIQFHDITRQQVEHVREALGRLGSESVPPWDAAGLLELQSMQLADAGEKFSASVASIVGNLDAIAGSVLEMAGGGRDLWGLSEDEKNSFFLELERGLSAILDGFSGCAEAERATRAASGGMAETTRRMRRSLEEIRTIEIQMQWMALNASIRAAHIGAPGNVLGVLADAMQKLASECAQRSDTLAEALGSMSQAATRLSGQDGSAPAGDPDTAVEGMRTAVAGMHSWCERSFAQIAQVAAHGASLSKDLSAARGAFSVGALFAAAIGRARGALHEIAGETPSGRPPGAAGASPPGLADFARHYTMQAEREVHQAALKPTAAAPASAPASLPCPAPAHFGTQLSPAAHLPSPSHLPSQQAEEFGDNVELF